MTEKPEVYFGACDRQMEFFLSENEFVDSLVFCSLFHGDLVVPDIFFYISSYLSNILTSDHPARNYICSGIKHGAIIPAFRYDTSGSFKKNLDDIRSDKIQGLNDKANIICDSLESIVVGKRNRSKIWPERPFSVGFKNILEHTFLSNDIPRGCPELEGLWEDTYKLRQEIFQSTPIDSFGGFKRGDVQNLVAYYALGKKQTVHDIRSVWVQISDQPKVEIVKKMMKLTNYCYHFNQSKMLELNPGLFSLDRLDVQFSGLLTMNGDKNKSNASDVFRETFPLPSVRAILTISPDKIFTIRDSSIGDEYFSKLKIWQKEQTCEASNALLDALKQYVSAISEAYLLHGKHLFNWDGYLTADIEPNMAPGKLLEAKARVALKKTALGKIIPFFGVISSLLGPLVATIYRWDPKRLATKHSNLFTINKRIQFEIDDKTKKISDNEQVNSDMSISV